MQTLLIRACRLVDPSQGFDGPADLLLEDGHVCKAAPAGTLPAPAEGTVLEARGLVAAPGLVDMHTHLRDPGQTDKEDILSGCAAAKAGGVTTLLAMPNTVPCADSPEVLRYVQSKGALTGLRVLPAAAVTLGQHGESLTDFEALSRAGAAAFSDDGHPVPTAALMREALRAAAKEGKPLVSHCEEPSLPGGLVNEGKASRALGVPGMPAEAEELMAARELVLAMNEGLPVHLAHISTAGSLAMIRDFKRRGAPVTCETCPHYFALDESRVLTRDADYRMNPPLRTPGDVEAVKAALADGTIDCIVTDHAPHTAAQKADFFTAPNGVVGLETSLAAGITFLVRPGILTLSRLIEAMSTTPARILGIGAGSLKPGSPADVVLFKPDEPWAVEPSMLHSKSKNTAFKGMTLFGRVHTTIAGGHVVFRAEMPANFR